MANINALFATLLGHAKGFEAYRSQFFADFDHLLCLQVAQMPINPDLAIFVVTTDNRQNDCFTSCTCARGKNKQKLLCVQDQLSALVQLLCKNTLTIYAGTTIMTEAARVADKPVDHGSSMEVDACWVYKWSLIARRDELQVISTL